MSYTTFSTVKEAEPSHYLHGKTKTPIHYVWLGMKQRCYNPNNKGYKNYGGRGISICEKWKTFKGFWEDMGEGYSKGLSIDRINNDGNYCKENCRWATRAEQNNNTRNSRFLTLNGETKTVAQWAKKLRLNGSSLYGRLNSGWSLEKTLTTPPITRNKGYCYDKSRKKYLVYICRNGKTINMGRFKTESEAIKAREESLNDKPK